MERKRRLSASVDAALLAAVEEAVAEGWSASLSAWVNEALALKVDRDRRLRALDDFLAAYEVAHGEITEEEMQRAGRRARDRAVVVRGQPAKRSSSSGRRPRGAA